MTERTERASLLRFRVRILGKNPLRVRVICQRHRPPWYAEDDDLDRVFKLLRLHVEEDVLGSRADFLPRSRPFPKRGSPR